MLFPAHVLRAAAERYWSARCYDPDPRGLPATHQAIAVYLVCAVDKCSDYWSAICSWNTSGEKIRNTFVRQAIPMMWDYAEANPFCASTGNWMAMVEWVVVKT